MSIHDEVLETARRLCRERKAWKFRPDEVVRALPHLNPRSVRTHIVSRCCVNAPKIHPHKWDYFRRVARGVYEILPGYRTAERRTSNRVDGGVGFARYALRPGAQDGVAGTIFSLRSTVHAAVFRDRDWYAAECLEIAVVTQGRTLDEVVSNLREAIGLHLEGENRDALGVAKHLRLSVSYELPIEDGAAP